MERDLPCAESPPVRIPDRDPVERGSGMQRLSLTRSMRAMEVSGTVMGSGHPPGKRSRSARYPRDPAAMSRFSGNAPEDMNACLPSGSHPGRSLSREENPFSPLQPDLPGLGIMGTWGKDGR